MGWNTTYFDQNDHSGTEAYLPNALEMGPLFVSGLGKTYDFSLGLG